MKLNRSLQVALFCAVLFTRALAQTEADISSLLLKAQHGNAIAQYRLGVAYSAGQGVPANPIEAYIWLSLAYENGFRGKALGNVAGGLDAAQLETARAQLAERRASLNQKAAPAKTDAAETDTPVVRTSPAPQSAANAPVPAPGPSPAQELAAAVSDKQQLSSELSKSWAETDELKKQLVETQATAEFLTAETSKLRGERDSLSAKFEALTNETAVLRSERDSARTLGAQAEQSLAQAGSQKAALEASLQAAQASAATDKKSLADELAKSFQEVSALKSRLAELNNKIASAPAAPAYPDLSGKVRELEASQTALVTEATTAKQEAARLADDRIAREKQLLALQQQNAALDTALSAAKSAAPAYPDFREQMAALTSQLAASKAEAGQASQQITALIQAKEAAEKSLAQRSAAPVYPDLSGKVRELENSLAAITTEATAAKQEAARLADERIEREKQLIALQQQNASLDTALSAAKSAAPAYPDLRKQVASLEKQLATSKTEAGQQITALTQAKESAEKSLAQRSAAPVYPDLSGKVRELETSLAALTTEATAAKQEATRLADDRIEREKQLIAVQQQSAALADKNTALQQEAENLRHAAATPAAPTYPDLREQVASLTNQLAASKAEAGQASQQITALTQAKEAAEKSLAQRSAAPVYPDLSGKVRELENSLAAITTEATAAKQEAARLADDRIEREKQLIALQQQVAALTQAKEASEKALAPSPNAPAYPDLSGKVQELTASLITLTAEANAAGKAIEELRQAKTEAEKKQTAAEQSRTELAQQFDEFKRSALSNQRENLSLQSKLQILESEKAALRQQAAADQTRLADLSSQLAASRRQASEVYPTTPAYPDQRARVEQLEAELTKTNEQANSMVTLLNRSQQEAREAANQTEQLRATIRTLENKIAAVETVPAYPDLREQVATLTQAKESAEKALARRSAAPAYPDLSGKVHELEASLAAITTEATAAKQEAARLADDRIEREKQLITIQQQSAALADKNAALQQETENLRHTTTTPAAPAYPDLRTQVASLETQLTALTQAKESAEKALAQNPATPAYPDLREQVNNLEIQLEAARNLPKLMVPAAEFNKTKQELADTKEKLGTTLRGYALIEKERDELAKRPAAAAPAYPDLRNQVTSLEAELKRTTAQYERDLAAARAQSLSAQNAGAALAQQNFPPKAAPAPEPVASRTVPGRTSVSPATTVATPPAVASAPTPVAPRRTHLVVGGDSLAKLSQRYYGTPNRWQEIYNANREVIGANGALRTGTELRIP